MYARPLNPAGYIYNTPYIYIYIYIHTVAFASSNFQTMLVRQMISLCSAVLSQLCCRMPRDVSFSSAHTVPLAFVFWELLVRDGFGRAVAVIQDL